MRLIYEYIVSGLQNGLFLFNAKKTNKAIRFIENFCHHCEGRTDLLKLELWQKAAVSLIFGIVDEDNVRIFREVFIVIGRKNGKTLFASAVIAYMAYLDGEYMENHYKIMIIRQPLMISSRYIREVGGVYKAQCQTEDFISQIEQWDEVAALSDAQYQRLITNPMIPECIERHLGRNDHYWESVSEAAHGLVRQASKQPDCFTPEAENPYPLCIGSGKSECDDCCLYMHMKGEGGYEC